MARIILCSDCGTKLQVRDGFTAPAALCSKCGSVVQVSVQRAAIAPVADKHGQPRPTEPDDDFAVPQMLDDEPEPVRPASRPAAEPEYRPVEMQAVHDENESPPAKIRRRPMEHVEPGESRSSYEKVRRLDEDDLDQPRPKRKKKKKPRRPPQEEESGSSWVVWLGAVAVLIFLGALIVPVAIKAGHEAEVVFIGISMAIMLPVSIGILVLSMIISSSLTGGIDFGEAKTAILKAAGLLIVVNLVLICTPYPFLGVTFTYPIWLFGLMWLFGLDIWEARFLVFINGTLNGLVKIFLLVLILHAIMHGRDHDGDLPGPAGDAEAVVQPADRLHWIESLGGQYETDPNQPDNPVVLISFAGKPISDDDLDRLDEFPQLHFLDLSSTTISDEGLAQIANLRTLQFLDLTGTRISDAGLEHLAELTDLQGLTLSRTRVTAGGVANLQKLLPRCKMKH